MRNGFPSTMFDAITGKFLNNQFIPKAAVTTVPKKLCVIVVPYLGLLSIFVNRKLKRIVHKFYPRTDLRIVYKRGNSIRNLFAYKDKLPINSLSSVVYKIQCDVCGPSAAYIGKTINTISRAFLRSKRTSKSFYQKVSVTRTSHERHQPSV